jgi:elongation factor P
LEITTLADTSDFKTGMAFQMDGDTWTLIEFQHVKPGKGGAFVRTKLRKIKTGQVLEKTFRSGEKIEPVFVEKMKMQFLFRQMNDVTLMDMDSYEQIVIEASVLGDQAEFLKEDMEIICVQVKGEVLGYELPNFVELEVVETDPGERGNTVSGGATKAAKMESGATIQVPFHINIGDILKVDTRSGSYLERVKK